MKSTTTALVVKIICLGAAGALLLSLGISCRAPLDEEGQFFSDTFYAAVTRVEEKGLALNVSSSMASSYMVRLTRGDERFTRVVQYLKASKFLLVTRSTTTTGDDGLITTAFAQIPMIECCVARFSFDQGPSLTFYVSASSVWLMTDDASFCKASAGAGFRRYLEELSKPPLPT